MEPFDYTAHLALLEAKRARLAIRIEELAGQYRRRSQELADLEEMIEYVTKKAAVQEGREAA